MKRLRILISPIIIVISLFFLISFIHKIKPQTQHQSQCNGNACNVVSINYTGNGYAITNHSGKKVSVSIRFTFGFQCMSPTNIELNPGQTVNYGNGAYCNPVTAIYN
jgi:hypothetical protein